MFNYLGMAQDLKALIARAEAAAVEARRLIEINLDWQERASATLRRMRLRAIFEGVRKPTYPQDLREQQRPYQPFPNGDDLLLCEDAAT
jgi:hypothetical protein